MGTLLKPIEQLIEMIIFAGRWIQMPVYLGLIVASVVYCYRFVMEVVEICHRAQVFKEEELLIAVLSLVDITMVLNLVYMVVIGGYTMFVSKLDIEGHPDRPEWLEHTNANTLKIKLASSLVGVSGIHLLKTFIELGAEGASHTPPSEMVMKWQVIIHATFLGSAIALAITERLLHPPHAHKHESHQKEEHAAEDTHGGHEEHAGH